jgi:transcriptional regulator with PAS, ATPase and Fis domain
MQKAIRLLERVAGTDATILVRGESGTGKELVARALHHNGPRQDRLMVTVNCAALQETLLESELFGHEKGSFTGATQAKPGLIEVAEGGTLFIDEVAEMAPSLQAKLLRVLEDRHFRRVGGTTDRKADVRVIAATNKRLEEEQKGGRFRPDLFHRLNVIPITLPPLRERREDVPALVEHFLATRPVGNERHHVHPDAMRALVAHGWPGNVRELANVLQRAQVLGQGQVITLDDLPEGMITPTGPEDAPAAAPQALDDVEWLAVQAALRRADGNKVRAARALGITRRTLYRLIEKNEKARDAALATPAE